MAAHGVQGRGVLVNLYRHFGESPRMEVGYDALMRVLDAVLAAKTFIGAGALVTSNTGENGLYVGAPARLQTKCADEV